MDLHLHRVHFLVTVIIKAAPEEVRLEATAEDSQRWCRRDVVCVVYGIASIQSLGSNPESILKL